LPSFAVPGAVLSPFDLAITRASTVTVRPTARWSRYTYLMTVLRLTCSAFWVDVRLREINGRWIASADTPHGPSLGLGDLALDAIAEALAPFEGTTDELLASVPDARI